MILLPHDYSNYIVYLTVKPVDNAKVLSSAQSFKPNHLGNDKAETFICLIEECNISYLLNDSTPLALLPLIVSLINEGSLIGTSNYIECSTTLMHPVRNYLFIDNLPLYAMYENFYINLNKDLNILGYSPEEIN